MKSTNGKVVLGLLGGVAVGALLGILFAPDKGSKTRQKILDKGQDYADDIKSKLDNLYEDVTDKYEDLMQSAKEFVAKTEVKI